jgi:RHS repeat-associated protein
VRRSTSAAGRTDGNGDSAAFIVDGIGNQVGALTDTGSNAFTVTYDPYGTGGVTAGSTSPFWTQNPFGFKVGARASRTQSDIVRFGLRWYLPTTGTWTQRDTLDAPLDPNNADRYAYAGDDPINNSDGSGRSAEGWSKGLQDAGVVLGAASAVATFTGFVPLGLGLSALSTGASVASRLAVGDGPGAAGAGLLGAATLGLGGLGAGLKVSDAVAGFADVGYTGIEAGTGYLSS